jgi:hypothetical protein
MIMRVMEIDSDSHLRYSVIMGHIRRSFMTGTKLPSERVFRQQTRKSCRCCHRDRLPDEEFSQKGYCSDCSTANLIAALMGQQVSEHWVEGSDGKRTNHHRRLVADID